MYLNRIRMAITAYRTDRSAARAPARRPSRPLSRTVVFAVTVVVLIWLRRKLDAVLDRRYGQKIESLAAKSQDVVSIKRLWQFSTPRCASSVRPRSSCWPWCTCSTARGCSRTRDWPRTG